MILLMAGAEADMTHLCNSGFTVVLRGYLIFSVLWVEILALRSVQQISTDMD